MNYSNDIGVNSRDEKIFLYENRALKAIFSPVLRNLLLLGASTLTFYL